MDKFNKLYESIMNEGNDMFKGIEKGVDKLYARARAYKPANVKIGKDKYVLVFSSSEGLFKVFDTEGNDITSELGMGAGMNTRKLATAKKDLKDWFMN